MTRIDFHGRLVDEPEIRAAVIGCGSHAFRNVYPTFQFAPVELVATCDLDAARAEAFAAKFGASRSFVHHRAMLDALGDDIDAVFLVLGYDEAGRPLYPPIALDCLEAGRAVWMEKPPAASTADIDDLRAAAGERQVMVGFKKMYMPANEHARRLVDGDDFGRLALARLEYPQYIPTVEEFDRYAGGEAEPRVTFFLDHLCHPVSALIALAGPPSSMRYDRAGNGAGVAVFTYADGALATIDFTWGGAFADGLERTVLTSDRGRHIVIDNNLKVSYHRMPVGGYGDVTDFYTAPPDEATAVWQPEFSLGQLYNKGLFLLGYYGEVNEFARAVLDDRPVAKAGLDDAWLVTHIFEAFGRGPGQRIEL